MDAADVRAQAAREREGAEQALVEATRQKAEADRQWRDAKARCEEARRKEAEAHGRPWPGVNADVGWEGLELEEVEMVSPVYGRRPPAGEPYRPVPRHWVKQPLFFESPRHLSAKKQKAVDKVLNSINHAVERALARRPCLIVDYKRAVGITDLCAYVKYIEAQFEPGMSWDNHGPIDEDAGPHATWQIDHIIEFREPGADGGLPTADELCERLHYMNTRPLWNGDHVERNNAWKRKMEICSAQVGVASFRVDSRSGEG